MKKWQKTGLLIVWCIIIAGCFYFRKELTTEQILNHTPGNLLAAFFMMMGLFAVKSVSVVIYSGLLFAVSGMIFPMKFAIAVNFCGAAIMVTLPWLIGKKGGGTMVSSIMKKYPKTEKLKEICTGNGFILTFLLRVIGKIPSDVLSLYLGAIGIDYKVYFAGSMLGLLPQLFTFPIMGMNIQNIHSTEFRISVGIEAIYMACSAGLYWIYSKKRKRK